MTFVDNIATAFFVYMCAVMEVSLTLPDLRDIDCHILRGDFSSNTDRVIEEQALIHQFMRTA